MAERAREWLTESKKPRIFLGTVGLVLVDGAEPGIALEIVGQQARARRHGGPHEAAELLGIGPGQDGKLGLAAPAVVALIALP